LARKADSASSDQPSRSGRSGLSERAAFGDGGERRSLLSAKLCGYLDVAAVRLQLGRRLLRLELQPPVRIKDATTPATPSGSSNRYPRGRPDAPGRPQDAWQTRG